MWLYPSIAAWTGNPYGLRLSYLLICHVKFSPGEINVRRFNLWAVLSLTLSGCNIFMIKRTISRLVVTPSIFSFWWTARYAKFAPDPSNIFWTSRKTELVLAKSYLLNKPFFLKRRCKCRTEMWSPWNINKNLIISLYENPASK